MSPCKITKSKLRAALKKANWSGLAQIPETPKKKLDKKKITRMALKRALMKCNKVQHGKPQTKRKARHSIEMKEYAELEVAFLRAGNWRTKGIPYHYSWEVIKRDGKSFEGREFFINHDEESGLEMGKITQVYEKMIDGVRWLVAKVRIPESDFAKGFLERIENGLIRFVSSTHMFITDKSRQVRELTGDAISTVRQPEVTNARILSIDRHAEKKNGD